MDYFCEAGGGGESNENHELGLNSKPFAPVRLQNQFRDWGLARKGESRQAKFEKFAGPVDLQDLRTEFSVAHTGADFHFCADSSDCANDFSLLIRRDAITPAQCRVGS
jgi:hypothetical protein